MCAVSNDWRTGMISLGLVGYADAQAEGRTRWRPLMTLVAPSRRGDVAGRTRDYVRPLLFQSPGGFVGCAGMATASGLAFDGVSEENVDAVREVLRALI